jgi:putative phosphoesterase
MISVGILSDTHGYVDPRILDFFNPVDEIWHAGDIGTLELAHRLAGFKPLRAVFGNIDGQELRLEYPRVVRFRLEEVVVLMTHIGGYPGRFDPSARKLIMAERPNLFVCGHSHILRVMYDPTHRMLCINPGAAGKYGLHRKITAIRLKISGDRMHELEVIDLDR